MDEVESQNLMNATTGESSNLVMNEQDNPCNQSSTTLSIKAIGPEVTNLQNILLALGYTVGPSGLMGILGPILKQQLLNFSKIRV